VLSLSNPSVTVLDTTSDRPIGTIPVGTGSRALAVAPQGRRLYVIAAMPNRLVIIDTTTEREIRTTRLVDRPAELAVGSHTARVFVITQASRDDFRGQIEGLYGETALGSADRHGFGGCRGICDYGDLVCRLPDREGAPPRPTVTLGGQATVRIEPDVMILRITLSAFEEALGVLPSGPRRSARR